MSVRGAEAGVDEAGAKSEERRGGSPRVHFEALVDVGEPKSGGFEAESVDVSPDGMRLRTAYLPEVGDKLACRFDGGGNELTVEGEVLWRTEEARGGEFGVRFVGLDEAAAASLRAMCAPPEPAEDEKAEAKATTARGARVRLHIEGLGSPMKARVRDATSSEVQVGSNLEFLRVGRALELEDVDGGAKRGAYVDRVEVDVDPVTNVPQLVLSLRFEDASKRRDTAPRASAPAPDAPRRATASAARIGEPKAATRASATGDASADESEPPSRASVADDADDPSSDLRGAGAKAAKAGLAMAGRIGPALAGFGARGKVAMTGLMAKLQAKRVERAEQKRASGPRRMTSPPPAGGLKSDGRRLVRDDGASDEESPLPPPAKSRRRAATLGGIVGLVMVLGIIGVTRAMASHRTAEASATSVAALPAAPPGSPSGVVTAQVPLFGVTPLSTTESVPAIPTPPPSGSAVAPPPPAEAPAVADKAGEEEPAADDGPPKKTWGTGGVSHPIVLKIKMDGEIERINGASGAMGFTVSVPGRRSVSASSELARKDKRLASVNVVNNANGAEITVQFKDGVPPYMAKVKGDRLEIALGNEKGDKKVASKSKKKDDGGKPKKKAHKKSKK